MPNKTLSFYYLREYVKTSAECILAITSSYPENETKKLVFNSEPLHGCLRADNAAERSMAALQREGFHIRTQPRRRFFEN